MAETTSNSYLFGINTKLDDLFRDAFERIGIIGNEQVPLHVQSALMSSNLELSSWPGRGLNLWLIRKEMLTLNPNQPTYTLPLNTVRVLEVTATQPVRLNTGGTAISSDGGNVANCFDPNQIAGCTQNGPDGWIAYDYGADNPYAIFYVGVTPLAPSVYTLCIECSTDMIHWTTLYQVPTQHYPVNQTAWFVMENAFNARGWRIRETGGATLAIQQIYFDQPNTMGAGDRLLSALSRAEYMAIATKLNTGFPSGYYFDQRIQSTITLWPAPSPGYIGNLVYTSYRYVQDVTQMFQAVEVPQRFYDAFVAGLSARLALKFKPEAFPLLKAEAQEAYALAAQTDFENVTMRFQPDFSQYGG